MRCTAKYQQAKCVLKHGHKGKHQAEFPKYHCHVDDKGKITSHIEQVFKWGK